jgi:hypothetical protein
MSSRFPDDRIDPAAMGLKASDVAGRRRAGLNMLTEHLVKRPADVQHSEEAADLTLTGSSQSP